MARKDEVVIRGKPKNMDALNINIVFRGSSRFTNVGDFNIGTELVGYKRIFVV